MKKLTSVILLFTLLASVLIACGDASGGNSGETTTAALSSDESTAPAETEPEGDKPDFEMTDYEGREFKILYPQWSLYKNFYFAEEANGEAMNDAIYERTAKHDIFQ